MEIVVCKTKEEASRKAAAMITAAVQKNPRTVLGLAAGMQDSWSSGPGGMTVG